MYSRQASVWMVKPGGTGKPGVGHLGEAGAFAAEFILHLAVAFGLAAAEEVNVLHGLRLGCRVCSSVVAVLMGVLYVLLVMIRCGHEFITTESTGSFGD